RPHVDLAIDLGTSNSRVVVRGRGVVLDEPTVLAIHSGARGREVRAFGAEAKRMLGRAPDRTRVVRPLERGVVADFEATELYLRRVLEAAGGRGLRRPRVLVCIATGASEVERRAVQESARAAGAREVALVPTPLAAAIGVDLPIREAVGSLVVDIGGGR